MLGARTIFLVVGVSNFVIPLVGGRIVICRLTCMYILKRLGHTVDNWTFVNLAILVEGQCLKIRVERKRTRVQGVPWRLSLESRRLQAFQATFYANSGRIISVELSTIRLNGKT